MNEFGRKENENFQTLGNGMHFTVTLRVLSKSTRIFFESKTENNILLTFLGARHHGFAVGPLAAPKNVNEMLFLQFLLRKIRVDLLETRKVTVKCIPFPNVFEARFHKKAIYWHF